MAYRPHVNDTPEASPQYDIESIAKFLLGKYVMECSGVSYLGLCLDHNELTYGEQNSICMRMELSGAIKYILLAYLRMGLWTLKDKSF